MGILGTELGWLEPPRCASPTGESEFVIEAAVSAFAFAYAGLQIGWSNTKVGNPLTEVGRPNLNKSKDSVEGESIVGYNFKATDKIVLSAEGGFRIGIEDAIRGSNKDSSSAVNPRYSFDLGARAGYLVTPETLVYVRGGYTNTRASVQIFQLGKTSIAHENFDGWSAGGGVERVLFDWLSVRAEYRYSDLRKEGSFHQHQALIGVFYHF